MHVLTQWTEHQRTMLDAIINHDGHCKLDISELIKSIAIPTDHRVIVGCYEDVRILITCRPEQTNMPIFRFVSKRHDWLCDTTKTQGRYYLGNEVPSALALCDDSYSGRPKVLLSRTGAMRYGMWLREILAYDMPTIPESHMVCSIRGKDTPPNKFTRTQYYIGGGNRDVHMYEHTAMEPHCGEGLYRPEVRHSHMGWHVDVDKFGLICDTINEEKAMHLLNQTIVSHVDKYLNRPEQATERSIDRRLSLIRSLLFGAASISRGWRGIDTGTNAHVTDAGEMIITKDDNVVYKHIDNVKTKTTEYYL